MDEPVLRNLTAHPVTIVTDDGEILIPPSGVVARCAEAPRRPPRTIAVDGRAVALVTDTTTTSVDGLPTPAPGVLLIVSRLVALATPQRDDLVFPHTPVKDDTGRTRGCRALARPNR